MEKLSFKTKMKVKFNKLAFKVKKNSPGLLLVAGVVCAGGSTVLACRATLKSKDILDNAKADLDTVHKALEEHPDKYSAEDAKKDTTTVYIQTGVKIAKAYLPSVILGGLGIACLVKSHDILKKRNVALAAAYATVDKSFKEYRERVKERFGDEVDKQLKYNIKAEEVKEETVGENGRKKTVKKTVGVVDDLGYSQYARFFDEGCKSWEKDPSLNLAFLRGTQNYFNDLLRIRGYVFLNEVYDYLGIPKTKAGQIVGWRYDPKDSSIDNYIDFGIYNTNRRTNRDFVNGYEPVILLDFNVDGDILNKANFGGGEI